MVETTELRWFAPGALPKAVWTWFTKHGALGVVEERCDVYRMDDRLDVGVKLRARTVPERKVRRSVMVSAGSADRSGGSTELPSGALEVWQKWSLADGLVSSGGESWLDVHKVITKRRCSITGEEITVRAAAEPPSGGFCDVEIVAIRDGAGDAWSFAFAAQGPRSSRYAGIEAAWRTMASVTPPITWPQVFAASCGYPEWLEQRVGDRSPTPER